MRMIWLSLTYIFFLVLPEPSIELSNPSFEGEPKDATVPEEWEACGPYSTPDILPGPWGVYQDAAHGNTFLGLISREDGTWEYIGQPLKTPIKGNSCYTFSVKLARSTGYVGYNQPLKLRIWGGSGKCKKEQLLGHTRPVEHNAWKTYNFTFFPRKTYNYIILEAYYSGETPYRGNILVDDCSLLEPCIRASL